VESHTRLPGAPMRRARHALSAVLANLPEAKGAEARENPLAAVERASSESAQVNLVAFFSVLAGWSAAELIRSVGPADLASTTPTPGVSP
jgi:hypothetical protein